MRNNKRKSLTTDIISSVSFIASNVYFIIYFLFIFPALTLAQINANSSQQNFIGALGVTLGSAIAVTMVTIIFFIIGIVFLTLSVIFSVLFLKSRKFSENIEKNKKYLTVQIIYGIINFIITIVIVYLFFTSYISFLPSLILSLMSFLSFIAGIFLKKSERDKLFLKENSSSDKISDNNVSENNSDDVTDK